MFCNEFMIIQNEIVKDKIHIEKMNIVSYSHFLFIFLYLKRVSSLLFFFIYCPNCHKQLLFNNIVFFSLIIIFILNTLLVAIKIISKQHANVYRFIFLPCSSRHCLVQSVLAQHNSVFHFCFLVEKKTTRYT